MANNDEFLECGCPGPIRIFALTFEGKNPESVEFMCDGHRAEAGAETRRQQAVSNLRDALAEHAAETAANATGSPSAPALNSDALLDAVTRAVGTRTISAGWSDDPNGPGGNGPDAEHQQDAQQLRRRHA